MALIKCKECGAQISNQASACPQCGAKAKQQTSGLTWFITILVVIGFISMLSSNDASTPSAPPPTPEQVAAQLKKDAAIQRAGVGAAMLKKSMRDPDSFKLESALVIDESGAVCYDYRAKNGFGGTNAAHAVLSGNAKSFKTSEMDGFAKLWNKECANKSGTEMAAGIRWLAL